MDNCGCVSKLPQWPVAIIITIKKKKLQIGKHSDRCAVCVPLLPHPVTGNPPYHILSRLLLPGACLISFAHFYFLFI